MSRMIRPAEYREEVTSMLRLSKMIERAEKKIEATYKKHKTKIPKYIGLLFLGIYFYGMIAGSVARGIGSVFGGETRTLITWNPIDNIKAAFSPYGLGLAIFIFLMYCLFTKKGYQLLSGYKTIRDKERGIEIIPEGTHGTSGWMDKRDIEKVLECGPIDKISATLFGKLSPESTNDYVGMKNLMGMSKNILIYGAPGTGKSRGFCMPFIMQCARRSESLICIDPKAEFYEMYSEYLIEKGYLVKAYNLLDLECADAWNCIHDTSNDIDLVQSVAEIIIRNTSNVREREDFWEKSEKNLLMALIHYVQTLTYPGTSKLLPIEERSLGTIYRILSSTSIDELDARFRALPKDHPSLLPYGIFRQAHKQIWGNIIIGLGSRLNVFQNKMIDSITKYNEIDLELPGKQKCAYFCIISDQSDALYFLSSMFFSLLFVKLFDLARNQSNRRLAVPVNFLMDEACNVNVLDFKKILSTARSRNINIQTVVQSVAQLADRFPRTEWEEIVGDNDYQLFLGCNDQKTAEFISFQCGDITIRVNNSVVPQTPLFSPVLNSTRPYTHNKTSTGRPLMMPDELRRLNRDQAILLVRGEKPLKLYKIIPDEHMDFKNLKIVKATDHVPAWRALEGEKNKPCAIIAQSDMETVSQPSQLTFEGQLSTAELDSVSDEYVPDEAETELNPGPYRIPEGISTLTQVTPENI